MEANIKQVKVKSNKEDNIEEKNFKVEETIAEQFLQLQNELNNSLRDLDLKTGPVEYIYNPLLYAFDPYEKYIRKYCTSTKELLFIGMNPGPFGMCQTGIPFGDPVCVRNFLQIEGIVNKPEIECPKREIRGFNSSRREQSGKRLWEFFENLCGTSEKFFEKALVLNFCPIAFMNSNGRNVTPAEIKDKELKIENSSNYYSSAFINVKMSQNVEFSQKECLFMDKAFFFAKEDLSVQEVPVGCVFVYNDDIIALGRNTVNETRNATRHAEINCIEDIVEYSKKNNLDYNQVFQETWVYVTVEPCIMCAAALYDLKIKRIVYGCKNDRFGGQTVFDVAGVMTVMSNNL
ncbi:unnamed protein product [Diabrotica balteata]|uniref:CMP/dCMP-type deaminase domain-containing protein n=1 Tax=Diabrotica balteata TaxID=107213 RepID=A0A9N9T2J9_DIABA|nr:unnamed protein product [Diabrotica balteata]